MGIYLNPGYENYRRTLSADIYVDKTMMIAVTNRFIDKGNNYICVSRPRRFGKTIAGEMLSAYYSKGCDAKELFAPYRIASDPYFEEKRNRYNVIKIDMNSEYQ
ncbi:MAG: AAA family ATPase, partial [Lachnospiraceae bacterium]|nr:AAA family ATPase [Lachnospiraceae bacterium]